MREQIEPLDDPLIGKNGRKLLRPAMPGAGRPLNAVNKLTRELKTALLDAAILSPYAKDPNDESAPNSLTNYCLAMCVQFPETYFQALMRLVPKEVNTSLRQESTLDITYENISQVRRALEESGMPLKQIEAIAAMAGVENGEPVDEETREDVEGILLRDRL